MKLYCTDAMQKALGERYKPAPAPTDPLDSWCAQPINLSSGCVLVALTEPRFAVLLWNIPKDQWDNLDQQIVQRIREALASYKIPQDRIDGYLPADTILEKCGAAAGTPAAAMTTLSNRVRKMIQQGENPQKIQDRLNTAFLVRVSGVAYDSPLQAVQKLLQEYKPVKRQKPAKEPEPGKEPEPAAQTPAQDGVTAMELEASLDLEVYKVRRTLIVPADINFRLLHCYLQEAFDWGFCHIHEFILPARRGRREMHLVDQVGDMFTMPDDELDRDYKLQDCLREGDSFLYIYDYGDYWEHRIRVRRVIPNCTEDVPICTLSEGTPPPEDVGGVPGFLDFYRIMQNPEDPEYAEMKEWSGGDWPHKFSAHTISVLMHNLPPFAEDF